MQLALELGGFLGYSAVRIADRMKDFGDVKLYSVEPNPHHQDIMQQMIGHAGLSSVVQIVPGTLQSHEHVSPRHSGSPAFQGINKLAAPCWLMQCRSWSALWYSCVSAAYHPQVKTVTGCQLLHCFTHLDDQLE